MAPDWRARVLDELDGRTDEMVGLLSDMVRVPSVSGSDEENSSQAELGKVFDRMGLDTDHWQVPLEQTLADPTFPGSEVARTEAWGLVGRSPGRGDGPSLMLNAHIDVVPPGPADTWRTRDPWSGRVIGGNLHGRGACDMKGGLVSAVWAVASLRASGVPLRGDVLLASVQGEEDGGLGSFATLQRGWRADACVIPEPTSLDIVPANAGALTFRLRIPGHATHASRHLEGISAIGKLWPIWQALQQLEQARNAHVDPLFARWELPYPICIGTVSSGVWASSVPDLLVAEGRLGVAIDEPVEHARAAFEEAVADACERDRWLRHHPVEVEWWGGQFASGRLSPDSPLLGQMRAAHEAVAGGRRQQVWGASYGSDLRLMEAAGVPTLQYGPGDAALAHSTDELVPVAEVRTAARALALLALDVCGV
ncbi:MAG: ylmB 2 [Frankiales bacterium]|jgi:acetylornithine deacetylase|nr:ylmB 2 [Frankiales bacterium]